MKFRLSVFTILSLYCIASCTYPIKEANTAISQAKEDGKPFFLYMAHYAVHAPFHSDPRFAENYKDSDMSEKAQAYATLIEGIDK